MIRIAILMCCLFGACVVDDVHEHEHEPGAVDLRARATAAQPASATHETVTIGPASVAAIAGVAAFAHSGWQVFAAGSLYFPVEVKVGCTIRTWEVRMRKLGAYSQISAGLHAFSEGTVIPIGAASAVYGTMGLASLTAQVDHAVMDRVAYSIRVSRDIDGDVADYVMWARVTVEC